MARGWRLQPGWASDFLPFLLAGRSRPTRPRQRGGETRWPLPFGLHSGFRLPASGLSFAISARPCACYTQPAMPAERRLPMVYVTIHGSWMILAVLVGTVAGYMGLVNATANKEGRSPLPGRFIYKAHVGFGAAYYAMIYVGALFGWIMFEFLLGDVPVMPPNIGRVHLALAISIATLYGAGAVLGWTMTKRPAGEARLRPRLHMALNFTACTLAGVQIALAAYYVWIWPA
jgi:hypothetical protein